MSLPALQLLERNSRTEASLRIEEGRIEQKSSGTYNFSSRRRARSKSRSSSIRDPRVRAEVRTRKEVRDAFAASSRRTASVSTTKCASSAAWIEKPLTIGAVTPSGKVLARTMARYVDPGVPGPVIELGPGTGPVTEALVAHGIDPSRLVLVEFDPIFCRLLRTRYPEATVVQGDAYSLKRLLGGLLQRARGGRGVRPAVVHQAAEDAAAAPVRGLRADVAGRAVRPVHLRRGLADPEAARPRARRSVRADLDEHSAGAGLGVSEGLLPAHGA